MQPSARPSLRFLRRLSLTPALNSSGSSLRLTRLLGISLLVPLCAAPFALACGGDDDGDQAPSADAAAQADAAPTSDAPDPAPDAQAFGPSGTLDPSFGGSGFVWGLGWASGDNIVQAFALQGDGKLLVGGYAYNAATSSNAMAIARLEADGSLDSTFGSQGRVLLDLATGTTSLAIDSQGRVVATGPLAGNIVIVRLTPSGDLDPTFSSDGQVTIDNGSLDRGMRVLLGNDDTILIGGHSGDHMLAARLTSTGAFDPTFNSGALTLIDASPTNNEYCTSMEVADDGGILLSGNDANGSLILVKLNSDGTPNTSFGGDGSIVGVAMASSEVHTDDQGRVLATGEFISATLRVARYTVTGALDTSFGTDGILDHSMGSPIMLYHSTRLPGGDLLLSGAIEVDETQYDVMLARIDSSGALVESFGNDGLVKTPVGTSDDYGFAVVTMPDGRIVVGGNAKTDTDEARAVILRYFP